MSGIEKVGIWIIAEGACSYTFMDPGPRGLGRLGKQGLALPIANMDSSFPYRYTTCVNADVVAGGRLAVAPPVCDGCTWELDRPSKPQSVRCKILGEEGVLVYEDPKLIPVLRTKLSGATQALGAYKARHPRQSDFWSLKGYTRTVAGLEADIATTRAQLHSICAIVTTMMLPVMKLLGAPVKTELLASFANDLLRPLPIELQVIADKFREESGVIAPTSKVDWTVYREILNQLTGGTLVRLESPGACSFVLPESARMWDQPQKTALEEAIGGGCLRYDELEDDGEREESLVFDQFKLYPEANRIQCGEFHDGRPVSEYSYEGGAPNPIRDMVAWQQRLENGETNESVYKFQIGKIGQRICHAMDLIIEFATRIKEISPAAAAAP